jgi:hypothetical protein
MKAYRDIIKAVSEEYAEIPEGGNSHVVMIGGEVVGGAPKADGTSFAHSDGPWVYKFKSEQLSCCDCFHPSGIGQDTLARMLKSGFSCSRLQPCCKETGDPLVDGRCERTEKKRVYYRGIY